jgi:hypothetical protein
VRAAQVRNRQSYHVLVAVGLVSFGIVHLVLAWIALQVALGGRGDASGSGALRELAGQPFGKVLMIVMAVGLFTLVLWQAIEAVVGGRAADDEKDRWKNRFRAGGRAVVYLVLGVTAASLALGSGGGGGGGQPEQTLTGRLLALPFGVALVVAVAAVIAGVGIAQIVNGVKTKFVRDLRSDVGRPVEVLGRVGYIAKGIALVIIGILFAWAALSYDPSKAGGMDAALTTIRSQPFGWVLLTAMAAGLACFGLFCFAWAKNAKH